jgi:reactive intermediate/imine deaminase
MSKQSIHTTQAPAAIGIYSQAIKCDNAVYISGQIPLEPTTATLITGSMEAQLRQIFNNLQAITQAAGGDLADIVKLTVFFTDLTNFSTLNSVMQEYFVEPYPARSVVGVAALPKGAQVEIEAIILT